MVNKNSKKVIKKENRIRGFCIFLSQMGINEEAKITNIAKKIGIHVNSVKDIIDAYETIKDAAKIEIIRDKDDKIKRIVRGEEENKDLIFRREIRESLDAIRKGISNMNNRMDSLEQDNVELKKEIKKEQ